MELFFRAENDSGLQKEKIYEAILRSLEGENHEKVLIIPPDITRFYSNAGVITNMYYHILTERGCAVDILPALGTHEPLQASEASDMYGDIPFERFIVHNWRTDVVCIGEVPGEFISGITEGLWNDSIEVEINRLIMDESYDLILSVGQVVPHEVIGMSNHAKNLFVGVGGSDMINKSHMVGAVYGMERMMGKDHTPVREIFDYALEHFLASRPIRFVLTVTTAPHGEIRTHGLFIGDKRSILEQAIALSQQKNIDFVEKGIKKCVVYLEPAEFRSTWLGGKAIYRTRMAMADGGELIILAPGITKFGEDVKNDALIRKYGYCGRLKVLELFKENDDLRENMSAAAHLIHNSPDGRFSVTYAVKKISQEEIRGVCFDAADYDICAERYCPEKLKYGWNTMDDGEEIFFIPNPAIGLWIDKERFGEE